MSFASNYTGISDGRKDFSPILCNRLELGMLLVALSVMAWPDLPHQLADEAIGQDEPVSAVGAVLPGDWPQFRGPDGQGNAPNSNPPTSWTAAAGAEKNIAWKTPIPGAGWSSPVVADGRIWVTTSLNSGKSLRAISLDFATGKVLHNVEVFKIPKPGKVHGKNSYASPTPILADGRVYVHFGAFGTAALSQSGEVLWRETLVYHHHHGPASCPVLAGNRLIIACDGYEEQAMIYQGTPRGVSSPQFIACLNTVDGKILWKTPRKGRHSYATPLVIDVDGVQQVVCPGGDMIGGYDVATGNEIWRCTYDGYSVIPRPLFENGVLYYCTGYGPPPEMRAVRPTGKGDITSMTMWTARSGVPHTPSPILVDGRIYAASDAGIASCWNAENGALLWKERLGGNYSASPVQAGGYIYFCSEQGDIVVIRAGKTFERVSRIKMPGRLFASPAVVGDTLLVRTDKVLYRIETGARLKSTKSDSKTSDPNSSDAKKIDANTDSKVNNEDDSDADAE